MVMQLTEKNIDIIVEDKVRRLARRLDLTVKQTRGQIWLCDFKGREIKLIWGYKSDVYKYKHIISCLGMNNSRLETNPDILLFYVIRSNRFYFAWLRDLMCESHYNLEIPGSPRAKVFPIGHFECFKPEEFGMLESYKLLASGPQQMSLPI